MKISKKLVLNILTCFMLVSCIGFNILADENDEINILEENEEIVDILEGSEEVDIPDEYLQKVTNIATNFAWAMSGGGNFLFGACLSGGIAGIFDVTVNLLKNVIVFGPSADDMFKEELMDKLNAIDAQIGDVNAKVDSMQDSINAAVKQIDAKLDDISIKLDKENITNVAKVADSLRNYMNNYDATLTAQVHRWYDNKNIGDFLTRGKYVVKGSYATDSEDEINEIISIFVDKDIMSKAIDDYALSHIDEGNEGWDPDNKDKIAKDIFYNIGEQIAITESNEEFIEWINNNPSFGKYTSWADFSEMAQDNILQCFADMGYGTLCELAAKHIAQAQSSDAETYVQGLIEKFNLYCNYLFETNDNYVSPLRSYYNMYSSLYAFQGDLNRTVTHTKKNADGKEEEITEKSDLLDIARQKYISELNELGTFVGIMAKASGNYGEKSDMRSLIYLPWAKAEKKLDDDYNTYILKDDDGNRIDNYCYITKSVLEYKTGDLKADMDMKFYAWENGFGTDIKSYRDTYMVNDWNYNIANSDMVDTTNLSLIFAHFTGVYGKSSFIEYLKTFGIDVNEDIPTTVITKFIGGRDFTSEDKVKMFIKNCHNNPDKWSGKDYTKGDTTTVTSSSSHFKIRRKGVADVFDLATGVATNSKRLGAVASFYEKYTFKDDLVVFWDAEYNSPQDIDEIKELASEEDFYWRERYDTKSDDEERYKSHVNYSVEYGTIVNKPVQEVLNSGIVLKNILNDDSFLSALNALGITMEEYIDFCFDDTYEIYFDESKYDGKIDEYTYEQLLSYLKNENNINRMTKDYFDINEKVNKIINSKDNQIVIETDKLDEIVKTCIENDLDSIVLDRVPLKNRDKNIYYYQTGSLYIWNNYKYSKYDPNKDIKIKKYEDETNQISVSDEPIFKNYPYKNSKNVEFKYEIKTYLAYELLFNENGDVDYKVHPIYDITPIITFVNDDKECKIIVTDEVLQKVNLNRFEIKIPVIQFNGNKDKRAVVNHYYDLNQMEVPYEKLTGVIYDKSYTLITVNSFSPFYVEKTYRYDYIAPVTGD